MSPARTPLRRLLLACLGVLAAILCAVPAKAGDRLVLAVVVDGAAQEDAVIAERRDGHLWVRADDLPALRPWAEAATGETDLDRVPGLTYRYDESAQSLAITLPTVPRPRGRRSARAAPPDAPTPNGWGAYLDYDTAATAVGGRAALDTALDVRLFAPRGFAYNTMLVHVGARDLLQRAVTRLDTGVSVPDPRHDRRLTVGDFIGGGTATSRFVRMGGVQLGTDFGLRPDLVTFPIPEAATQGGVPTTAELVADSVQRAGRSPAAGDFVASPAPVTTGVNTVRVTVPDALGRQSTQTVSFYASRSLLVPGLSSYSIEAGFVRTGYGSSYDRYRSFAGSGTFRQGLTSTLTLEAHGEVTRGVATIGGGGTLGLGRFGAVYLAAARSQGRVFDRAGGTQVALGWERLARPVSVSVQYVRNSRGYADIAARYATPVRKDSLIANIGFDLAKFGTVSAAYLRLGRGRQADDGRLGPGVRSPFAALDPSLGPRRLDPLSLVTATYAVPVAHRFSLLANVTRAIGEARGLSASVGLLIVMGPRASAQSSVDVRSIGTSGRVAVERPAVVTGDVGFRADVSAGAIARQAAAAEYIGTRGRVQAAVERAAGQVAVRGAAQGSVVLSPAGLFLADRVGGSFAVVDAGGEAGVPVLRDNRPVGTTDRRGFLVVPGLLPYQANRLSLDPEALDADVTMPSGERIVRPREHSGVLVGFGVRRTTSIVLTLLDEAGRPVPAGARASMNGRPSVPVGMDGEVYLTDLAPINRIVVDTGGHSSCEVTYRRASTVVGSARPPPLTCRERAFQKSVYAGR